MTRKRINEIAEFARDTLVDRFFDHLVSFDELRINLAIVDRWARRRMLRLAKQIDDDFWATSRHPIAWAARNRFREN